MAFRVVSIACLWCLDLLLYLIHLLYRVPFTMPSATGPNKRVRVSATPGQN